MTDDLRDALNPAVLARVVDILTGRRLPRPAEVWHRCLDTVAVLRAGYDGGSIEEQTLGRAYRALLSLDADGTWTDFVTERGRAA